MKNLRKLYFKRESGDLLAKKPPKIPNDILKKSEFKNCINTSL